VAGRLECLIEAQPTSNNSAIASINFNGLDRRVPGSESPVATLMFFDTFSAGRCYSGDASPLATSGAAITSSAGLVQHSVVHQVHNVVGQ
jgi:hypothetical protein